MTDIHTGTFITESGLTKTIITVKSGLPINESFGQVKESNEINHQIDECPAKYASASVLHNDQNMFIISIVNKRDILLTRFANENKQHGKRNSKNRAKTSFQ